MATWGHLSLLDRNSPAIEQFIFFHDHSMIILSLITILVSYIIVSACFNSNSNRFFLSGSTIEIIWTIVPATVVVIIGLPSLRLLYLIDEILRPSLTIKTIGHQWYWRYEYSDFNNIEFDSYIIPTNDLKKNDFRLLDVDNRFVLPVYCKIRALITSLDVLHSWAVPSLGIKIDAVPGRLNQTNIFIYKVGLFFGQCSEICGANHRFIPIVVEAIPAKN